MSKKDTWKMILQTLISILTAIGTTLGELHVTCQPVSVSVVC